MILKKKQQNNHKNDFWIGFSDLMTGLMLVFIVLSLTFMAISKLKMEETEKSRKKIEKLLKESEESKKQVEELLKKSELDRKKMQELIKKVEAAKENLEKRRKNIIVILSKKLASNNIKVEYNTDKGTVTIAQDILFEQKKPDLNKEGKNFIELFAKVLDENIFSKNEYKDLIKYVHIEGYASKEGSLEHNFDLSYQRAKNVWLYMTGYEIDYKSIMEKKLNIVSRGEIDANQQIVEPNDRKVVFRFEFYDDYSKLFKGLSTHE